MFTSKSGRMAGKRNTNIAARAYTPARALQPPGDGVKPSSLCASALARSMSSAASSSASAVVGRVTSFISRLPQQAVRADRQDADQQDERDHRSGLARDEREHVRRRGQRLRNADDGTA